MLRHLTTVSDPTRCRMLRVLTSRELTVTELCQTLHLPQSTVSRHLKTLLDEDWVESRRAGTSRFYQVRGHLPDGAAGIWEVVQSQLQHDPELTVHLAEDDRRVAEVLADRRTRAQSFFATSASGWDRLRTQWFGSAFHLQALPALLDPTWVVGDLGCGTGLVTEAVAPYVQRVVAVDGSEEMLASARGRLHGYPGVEFHHSELEQLPLPDGCLNAAWMMLVLAYVPDPLRVLEEARRVLIPGGRMLVVDLQPNDDEARTSQLGTLWPGFTPADLADLLSRAGFHAAAARPLPGDGELPLATAWARR